MYKLKNYMEDLVIKRTDEILKSIDVCKCDKCKLDIIALALNSLPSKYVVSAKGELYAKVSELEQQFDIDVGTAIIKAAFLVNENPRHNEE
ncbi:MAG TPA: late competence development ComFB family protein [Bacillota bacterium]|nr:late competence development ComFB family protein [Bacillota bacterium]HNT02661.1 late competence development ComFB family protein [Bacillota bacterium]HPX68699.1 late competence development ComFB family protein [Bacillota bacterium]HQA64695.1 late competence development ComFB family protein [Bacillota bacterium]HQO43525.1 late competence development ComFB family protein [Bacillota bacterium]